MQPTVDDVLNYLTVVYPKGRVTMPMLQAMREDLRDAPGPFLMEAAKEHVRTSRWFPTVAELVEQLEAVRERRQALADVLRHERLARERQIAAERPYPPLRDPRCRRLNICYTDEELYQMEVAQGTIPSPEELAERDERLVQEAAQLRKALGVGSGQ
jgi:hypothetical protein